MNLTPDCLAIANAKNETLWVRSNVLDLAGLSDSLNALAVQYPREPLYPLLSHVDDGGTEKLTEFLQLALKHDALDLACATQVEVWHERIPCFGLGPKKTQLAKAEFDRVALVRVPRLDDAEAMLELVFEFTQSVFAAWHPRVRARSTSTGDVLVLRNPDGLVAYLVESTGWRKVIFE